MNTEPKDEKMKQLQADVSDLKFILGEWVLNATRLSISNEKMNNELNELKSGLMGKSKNEEVQ